MLPSGKNVRKIKSYQHLNLALSEARLWPLEQVVAVPDFSTVYQNRKHTNKVASGIPGPTIS